ALRGRRLHLQFDDLVAGGRVAVGQTAPAQAQLAAGLRIRRNLQLDLAAERGHADRRAERCFPRRHRQGVDDVAAVDLELRVRGVLDLQQQVAAVRTLPGQPDHLPRPDALGHPHVEGLAIEPDADAVAAVHRLQRHRQARAQVGGPVRTARLLLREPAAALAPEQAFEEVAEAAARPATGEDLVEIEAFRRPAAAITVAAGRRLHLVAGTVAAGAQLVVG